MGSMNRSTSRSMRHLMWIPIILVAVVGLVVAMPEARGQGHEGHDHGEETTQTQQTTSVDSVRILEQAVAADSSYDNLYRLGVAYLDRDRAIEAVRMFRRCTELKPKDLKFLAG